MKQKSAFIHRVSQVRYIYEERSPLWKALWT